MTNLNRLLAKINPHRSFRTRLGLTIGAVILICSLLLSFVTGATSKAQLEGESKQLMTQLAEQIALALDDLIFERYRDIQIFATFSQLRSPKTPLSAKRMVLEQLKKSYPDYAWIGLTDPSGTILISTEKRVEGVSAAQRPWFIEGQKAPSILDLHEPQLLKKFLPHPQDKPLQFIDVVAPVFDDSGLFQGVLAAHLDWNLLRELRGSLLEIINHHPGIEILIRSKQGEIVFNTAQKFPNPCLSLKNLDFKFIFFKPNNTNCYVNGIATSKPYQDYPGLRWTVIVREKTDTALAPAQNLQTKIIILGLIFGGLSAGLSWWLAGRLVKPIVAISAAAEDIRQGNIQAKLPTIQGADEVAILSASLSSMIFTLRQKKQALAKELAARQQAEVALLENQAQIKAILDHSPSIIYAVDKDNKILLVNQSYEMLMSMNKNQIVGKSIYEIWGTEIADNFAINNQEIFTKKVPIKVEESLWIKGKKYTYLSIKFPLLDAKGNIYAACGISTDISDRKQVEEELQLNNHRFRVALQNLPIAVFSQDLDLHYTWLYNPQPGYNGSELLVESQTEQQALKRQVMATGVGIREEMSMTLNGEVQYIDLTLEPMRNLAGEITGIMGAAINITKHKLIEIDLQKNNEQLETRVEQRTAELKQANELLLAEISRRYQIEAELREQEQKFRAIFDQTFEFIGLLSPDGRVLETNQASLKFSRVQREEVVGYFFWETPIWVKSSEVQETLKASIAEAAQGHFVRYEISSLDAKGQRIYIDFSIKPVKDETGRVVLLIPEGRDITAYKRALQAVEREKAFSQRLIESSFDGIIAFDTNGCYTVWNLGMERLTGISRSQLIGKKAFAQFPCLNDFGDPQIFQVVLAGKTIITKDKYYEIPRIKKQGFFEACYSPIKDESGQIIGGLGVVRDITERKQAETSLRHSEERFRQLVDNIESVFWMSDAKMNETIYVSPASEKIWGRSCESLYARPQAFFDLIHLEDINHVIAALPNISQGKYNQQYRIIKPDGEICWIHTRAFPIRDERGEIYRIAGISEDITDRKQAEEVLQQQAQIIQQIRAALILTDIQQNIIFWNRGAEQIYGYTAAEVLGQPISLLYPPDKQCCFPQSAQKLLLEKGEYQIEAKAWKKSGEEIDIFMSLSLLKNLEGIVTGTVGYSWDITDRKQIENQMRASLAEKEVLLKEIHHRVKNNLQIVSGFLYLQSRYVEDEQTLQVLTESQNRIQAMAVLHEKLYGSENLDRLDFEDYMQTLAQNAFLSYRINTGIITLKIHSERIWLDIDRAIPCGLIVNELVSNALKHGFPQGQSGEITVDFHSLENDTLELAVSDNGIGLKADFDWSTQKSLGMRLVYSLATKQLDGAIEAIRDKGTKIKITFSL